MMMTLFLIILMIWLMGMVTAYTLAARGKSRARGG
jgi:hypothetical protein